MTLNELE